MGQTWRQLRGGRRDAYPGPRIPPDICQPSPVPAVDDAFEQLIDQAQPRTPLCHSSLPLGIIKPLWEPRLGLRGGGSQRIAVSRQIEARERIHVSSTYHVTQGRVEHKRSSVYNGGWELA